MPAKAESRRVIFIEVLQRTVSPAQSTLFELYRRLPRGLRTAAWHAVHRLPPAAQRLFPNTSANRSWKMRQLYSRTPEPVATAPTVLFWVPGGMELMLHVESAIAAALQLRGYKVHAVICDATYSACVKRELEDGVPYEAWRDQCAACIASNKSVLDTMGIPFSFVGDFVAADVREELREKAQSCTAENVHELEHHCFAIGQNVVSSLIR